MSNDVNQNNNTTIRYLKIIDAAALDDYPVLKVVIENGVVTHNELIRDGLYIFPNMVGWNEDRLNRWLVYDHNNKYPFMEHIEIKESEIENED